MVEREGADLVREATGGGASVLGGTIARLAVRMQMNLEDDLDAGEQQQHRQPMSSFPERRAGGAEEGSKKWTMTPIHQGEGPAEIGPRCVSLPALRTAVSPTYKSTAGGGFAANTAGVSSPFTTLRVEAGPGRYDFSSVEARGAPHNELESATQLNGSGPVPWGGSPQPQPQASQAPGGPRTLLVDASTSY